MPEPLLIGSNNRAKARELALLLEGLPWEVKSLAEFPEAPEPVEDGLSFEDNACKKARYFCERYGVACVADDSGIAVDALGGAPGVHSARYSGPRATDRDNNAKLLEELARFGPGERTARFVCCVAFCRPGEEPHIELGAVEGAIATAPRGPQGFGYDPLFVPAGYTKTFAEMDPADKLAISHRGRALRKLRAFLETLDAGRMDRANRTAG